MRKRRIQHIIANKEAFGNLLLMRMRGFTEYDLVKWDLICDSDGEYWYNIYDIDGRCESIPVDGIKFNMCIYYYKDNDANKYLQFAPNKYRGCYEKN